MDFLPLIILVAVAVYFAARKPQPALTTCKDCGHQVSRTAAACPGCGAKVPKSMGMVGWLVLGFFTLFVVQCSTYSLRNEARKPTQTPEQKEDEAKQQILSDAKWKCREFITATLKAPSTAEFQNYNNFTAWHEGYGGRYSVAGYVDAQNSFGAMIRTQFKCDLQRDPKGNWVPINLSNH
jgi:hypothetical protein